MTTATEHDEFTCLCHETCSHCLESVLDSHLVDMPDGARICRKCRRDLQK